MYVYAMWSYVPGGRSLLRAVCARCARPSLLPQELYSFEGCSFTLSSSSASAGPTINESPMMADAVASFNCPVRRLPPLVVVHTASHVRDCGPPPPPPPPALAPPPPPGGLETAVPPCRAALCRDLLV
jgi:hypothetical protein